MILITTLLSVAMIAWYLIYRAKEDEARMRLINLQPIDIDKLDALYHKCSHNGDTSNGWYHVYVYKTGCRHIIYRVKNSPFIPERYWYYDNQNVFLNKECRIIFEEWAPKKKKELEEENKKRLEENDKWRKTRVENMRELIFKEL